MAVRPGQDRAGPHAGDVPRHQVGKEDERPLDEVVPGVVEHPEHRAGRLRRGREPARADRRRPGAVRHSSSASSTTALSPDHPHRRVVVDLIDRERPMAIGFVGRRIDVPAEACIDGEARRQLHRVLHVRGEVRESRRSCGRLWATLPPFISEVLHFRLRHERAVEEGTSWRRWLAEMGR